MAYQPKATLLTGASGFLGTLIAAGLLADPDGPELLLPVRAQHSRESVLRPIRAEFVARGLSAESLDLSRVHVVELPGPGELSRLSADIRQHQVEEIIHCAGCVDYFDEKALDAVNVMMTRELLSLGEAAGIGRFVYVSTAFSSGAVPGVIQEARHPEPVDAPTDYIRSKWRAEELVAGSVIPWLIVRPSIVIGHSRDGRYGGKKYGVYQLWSAGERLFCRDYIPELHFVAPKNKLPLLHQDAFESGFMSAYREAPAGQFVNLVSDPTCLPTVRDVYQLWCERVARPERVHYHERIEDVPMEKLDRLQRTFIEFANVNIEIACRDWRFERAYLDRSRAAGLEFAEATRETLTACLENFIQGSARIRAFMKKVPA